jgi:dihydrodipicolinate synthase/N-acetylneuraminate lyase
MSEVITGIIPVAPTVFLENEELDHEGQRRVVDYLVDGGVDAICILANYSEQFSLSDRERELITETTIEHTAGRVPIMVTTSHYSSRIAHQRSRDAQDRGASIVMLMAPFFGATIRVDEKNVLEYFKRVADGLDVDIMIQDAPMSPTTLSVELLARIAEEVPQVRYAKIEVPRTSYKVRELVLVASDSLPGIFDGEEAITLIPDLHAGVKGTMSSCVVPDQLGRIVREFRSGNVEKATADWEKVLPLIHYENRHCGLNASKYLMKAGGVIGSDLTRAPFPRMPAFAEEELLELAYRQNAFVLQWAK